MNSPRFSVITPVFDPRIGDLAACASSVLGQSFADWEWVIVDDGSSDPDVIGLLADLSSDPRITVSSMSTNSGIVGATNAAIELASGEFLAFLDHDDELTPDALAVVSSAVDSEPDTDFVYTDEAKIGASGHRYDWFAKPDWSPERLRGQNYCNHLSIVRASLARELGALREGFDGAQDHDLVFRVSERARRIVHIPQVLYLWRATEGSTAADETAKPHATAAGCRAIRDHLARLGVDADVSASHPGRYRTVRRLRNHPKASIIIPTRGDTQRVQGRPTRPRGQCGREHRRYLDVPGDRIRRRLRRVHACRHTRAPRTSGRGIAGAGALERALQLLPKDQSRRREIHWRRADSSQRRHRGHHSGLDRDPRRASRRTRHRHGRTDVAACRWPYPVGGTPLRTHTAACRRGSACRRPGAACDVHHCRRAKRGHCRMRSAAQGDVLRGGWACRSSSRVATTTSISASNCIEAGYRIVWTPHARLHHFESLTRDPSRIGPGGGGVAPEVGTTARCTIRTPSNSTSGGRRCPSSHRPDTEMTSGSGAHGERDRVVATRSPPAIRAASSTPAHGVLVPRRATGHRDRRRIGARAPDGERARIGFHSDPNGRRRVRRRRDRPAPPRITASVRGRFR